jgi:hypothetical protein
VEPGLTGSFARECTRKLLAGETFTASEFAAFRAFLDHRDRSGRPLLGTLAGPDGSIDTVTGRCGHKPLGFDLSG